MNHFETGNARLPRRRLLALLPAIAAPVMIPKAALAAPAGSQEPLTLTGADSLYYYQKLLSDVYAEAVHNVADLAIKKGQACDKTLDELRDKLRKLYERLSAASSQNANWPALQNQFRVVDRNLLLVQQVDPLHYSPQSVNLLPVTTASVASLLLEISSNCDPDPDGQIKTMLKEILKVTREENKQIEGLSANQQDLQKELQDAQRHYNECNQHLDSAMVALSQGKDAQEYLKQAIDVLDEFKESAKLDHVLSAKATLRSMLVSLRDSPVSGPKIMPASFSFFDMDPQQSEPSNRDLIDYVRKAVHDGFSPGITLQVVNCIAVCWPIWVLYPTNQGNDEDTRKQLIFSALYRGLCWGARHELLSQTTDALQKAYIATLRA